VTLTDQDRVADAERLDALERDLEAYRLSRDTWTLVIGDGEAADGAADGRPTTTPR
jgi:hypothetical protein